MTRRNLKWKGRFGDVRKNAINRWSSRHLIKSTIGVVLPDKRANLWLGSFRHELIPEDILSDYSQLTYHHNDTLVARVRVQEGHGVERIWGLLTTSVKTSHLTTKLEIGDKRVKLAATKSWRALGRHWVHYCYLTREFEVRKVIVRSRNSATGFPCPWRRLD